MDAAHGKGDLGGGGAVTAVLQGIRTMRMRGLEPPRTCIHTDLNHADAP
jgi:hypothetical protein